ncbi:hypothetical protein T484DRAFT_1761933, partial [Baffinella frigidus]
DAGEDVPENPDKEFGELVIGVAAQVTVWDPKDKRFCQATIRLLEGDQALVSFMGWNKTFDQWLPVSKMTRPEMMKAIPPPPAPSISILSQTASEAVVEVRLAEDSPTVRSYIFQIDDDAVSKRQKLDGAPPAPGGSFSFALSKHVALEPGVPLTVKVALFGDGKKERPATKGPWSEELAILLMEDEEEEAKEDGGKRAAGLVSGQASAKQLGAKPAGSEAPRREADPHAHHNPFCAVCYGGEREGETRLVACDGGCKR